MLTNKIHNNYKRLLSSIRMKKREKKEVLFEMNKKGQVAVFIIVAVVIIGIIIVLLLFPGLTDFATQEEFSPTSFLKGCIQPSIESNIALLAKQGGYINPEGALVYQGDRIKYLCYTSEYYQTCVVQQPMIKNHFEQELESSIDSDARGCIQDLAREYERRGFDITVGNVAEEVSINPGEILVNFKVPIAVSKSGEETIRYTEFNVLIESEMYDLLFIAQSIIDFESTYGDSETSAYIAYYPDLTIQKTRLSDGSTVYTVENVITREKFTFASRSLAWPPGYGVVR